MNVGQALIALTIQNQLSVVFDIYLDLISFSRRIVMANGGN